MAIASQQTIPIAHQRSFEFYLLPGLDIEISASQIRAQVRSFSPDVAVPRSVPAPVADYIRSHSLYR